MTWKWSFEGNTSSEMNPKYLFKSIGSKQIIITATTDKGCESTNNDTYLTIGVSAIADFIWDNECLTGDSVKFKSTSSGGKIKVAEWRFNGSPISTNIDSVKYKFTEPGKFNMTLLIETYDKCRDTITKKIAIQPYIKFQELPNLKYFQNFDTISSNYNWQSKGITDEYSSRWKLGTPDGETINISSSGENSWFTKLTDKTNIENSQVVSPCFDFTGLKKPMIKFQIWSSSEAKRDGAILQYSLDKGNTWTNIGKNGEGINWYNSDVIMSNPAGQIYGWSQVPMTGWTDARHDLDNLISSKNVRFRIAYAADGKSVAKVDGFAFDDVWIGERQQNVLNEYFTNATVAACGTSNKYMYNFEKTDSLDVIPIHYHTGIPTGDQLYNDYTAGPSSRGFYYGVSQVPYTFANGTILSNLINTDEFENSTNTESLQDPKISIGLNNTRQNLGVVLTAQTDLTGENLVLYCAVVKDSIKVDGVYYYNVLRNFLPSPGGTAIPTSGLARDRTVSISIPVDFENSPELIGSKLILFVQNSSTNQVYQSKSYRLTVTSGVDPSNISNKVDVYPNPASDYLMIDCEYNIDRLTIFDIAGRMVNDLNPLQAKYSLPIQNLENGIYIIKGSTNKGEFVKKFIKQ